MTWRRRIKLVCWEWASDAKLWIMERLKHFPCFNTCLWGKYHLTHTVTGKKTNSEKERQRQKQRHRESLGVTPWSSFKRFQAERNRGREGSQWQHINSLTFNTPLTWQHSNKHKNEQEEGQISQYSSETPLFWSNILGIAPSLFSGCLTHWK